MLIRVTGASRRHGRRFFGRQGGAPHAGGWSKHKVVRQNSPAKVNPAASSIPSAPEIVEIGTEDLGNGFLYKTIVITEVRDGVRTQRTKTITVPSHPRKTKKRKI